MSIHRPVAALIACGAVIAVTSGNVSTGQDEWLEVRLRGRSMLINPATADRQEAPQNEPTGVLSPDGKRLAYIASDAHRAKDGHELDLFVVDVDASHPSEKSNIRRLTTVQSRPADPQWLPDSSGIVFQAGEPSVQQVWYIGLAPDSEPVRLSDGQHRSYDVAITSDARVAWIAPKGSKNKQQFKDLVLVSSPVAKDQTRTLLTDQHICGYAISADGKTLAWSDPGSLFLMNLETNESREIPMQGVHPKLLHHAAHEIAWRPDGKIIAMCCGFIGGTAGDRPRMFAEDKVFFVPVMGQWQPTPESLKIGTRQEDYPSPFADDPDAEISPPASDESKPWWVRELPEHVLAMQWVSAPEARKRIP